MDEVPGTPENNESTVPIYSLPPYLDVIEDNDMQELLPYPTTDSGPGPNPGSGPGTVPRQRETIPYGGLVLITP